MTIKTDIYQKLDHGITCIDSGYMREQMAACYLVVREGEAAIVETGTTLSVPRVMETLDALDIAAESVRYVIPTHVHLDHAGGSGALMQRCPNATLLAHPRGARHLADPAKLVAGAEQVYGRERVRELYGEIVPVPASRMLEADDLSRWDLGNGRLLVRDTPGHARHHFCVWDETSRGWFSGDTFGIRYPELEVEPASFMLPTTTPVQLEPEAFVASIELLMSYEPEYAYLTHFGRIAATRAAADSLIAQISAYVRLAEACDESAQEQLREQLTRYTLDALHKAGCGWSEERLRAFLALDMDLNTQGLLTWKSRQRQAPRD